VTSDLHRAAATATVLARAWGIEPSVDVRLREMSFGDWEGLRWDEIAMRDAERLRAWGDDWIEVAPPGGESGRDLARRVETALRDLIALGRSGGPVVAVTHAGWIRVAATVLLAEPLSATFTRDIGYARGAAFRVGRRDTPRGELLAWDATDLF
jgi:broad specificity phosphatase PhoE